MKIRILRRDEIRQLLPMADCIELMAKCMIAVSENNALLPLRTGLMMPNNIGMLGNMPGYLGDPECFGVKLVSLFPRNAGTEFSSHLGLMILFEVEHGCPVALLDAAEITAIRTAAASGLATRLLARAEASSLAILGTGEQARQHLAAMLAVRPITQVHVWGRTPEKAAAFAKAEGDRHNIAIEVSPTVQAAVKDADIICTVSHAAEPILKGEWVSPGTHLNVVGSSIPSTAEIDTALVRKSRFFVDYRESTVNQAGEYIRALKEGAITESHILAEIGEVAKASKPGRRNAGDITLYKSLGVAAQDLAASHYVVEKANLMNIGQSIDF